MIKLSLLRHAKAESEINKPTDFERDLAKKGVVQANVLGALLNEKKSNFDGVFCSSALRTKRTLEIIQPQFISSPRILFDKSGLYLTSREQLLDFIQKQGGSYSSLMLIGHNFGISDLLNYLTGSSKTMSTCHFVALNVFVDHWTELGQETANIDFEIETKIHL